MLLGKLCRVQRLWQFNHETARVAVKAPLWTRDRIEHNSAIIALWAGCDAHAHEAMEAA